MLHLVFSVAFVLVADLCHRVNPLGQLFFLYVAVVVKKNISREPILKILLTQKCTPFTF